MKTFSCRWHRDSRVGATLDRYDFSSPEHVKDYVQNTSSCLLMVLLLLIFYCVLVQKSFLFALCIRRKHNINHYTDMAAIIKEGSEMYVCTVEATDVQRISTLHIKVCFSLPSRYTKRVWGPWSLIWDRVSSARLWTLTCVELLSTACEGSVLQEQSSHFTERTSVAQNAYTATD